MGKLRCWLILVILLGVTSSVTLGEINNGSLTRTNVPGSFFFLVWPYENDEYLWLAYTEEFGTTYDIINRNIRHITYHPFLNVLGCTLYGDNGRYVSLDSGQTVIQQSVNGGTSRYNWVASMDNLIAISQDFEYSYDTLQTWQYEEPRYPPYGNMTGTHDKRITGWGKEDQMIMTNIHSLNAPDSMCVNFSTTYGDSFFQIATYSTEFLPTNGCLCKGYNPGECYYVDWLGGVLFFSPDTGRTWEDSGIVPFQTNIYSVVSFDYGWAPGQLLAYHSWYDFWAEERDIAIWYTEDFGANWDRVYSLSVPDDQPQSGLPQQNELQAWPNPTNGEISIHSSQPTVPLILYDALGRRVLDLHGVSTIDLSSLVSGTYFLSTVDGQMTRKIVLIR